MRVNIVVEKDGVTTEVGVEVPETDHQEIRSLSGDVVYEGERDATRTILANAMSAIEAALWGPR